MFKFNAETFTQKGYGKAKGDWSDSDLSDIAKLKNQYPELTTWGDLAIGSAWGDFSQDVYLVGWCDWGLKKRDECFLSYCYWKQTKGHWPYGFDMDELILLIDNWKAKNL